VFDEGDVAMDGDGNVVFAPDAGGERADAPSEDDSLPGDTGEDGDADSEDDEGDDGDVSDSVETPGLASRPATRPTQVSSAPRRFQVILWSSVATATTT
jgi:hypothetical protein